ncbi:hypothetical protein [Micromonospora chokoriensis]|uniref:Secreted protein n=1 Tax=Micromonospora chokoriensis TaxID=356851 RepID=A0A1C4XB88_9ACTN|nr:hypothetical protein [Micromonospora chokoriensis]SCF05758.1 hypothetical protein GA0070612_3403 [Micromonospora chokoriensis]
MLRRRMLGIGLAALLLASGVTVASPASAAGAAMAAGTIPQSVLAAAQALAGGKAAATTPTFSRTSTARGPVTAAAADVITCNARAQYPHASTGGNGIPGSLDGKADSWCDAPIPYIGAQAELYQYVPGSGFFLVSVGGLNSGPGTKKYTGVAFAICQAVPNYYVTKGIHTYTAPGGYYPPSVTLTTQSPIVQVTC